MKPSKQFNQEQKLAVLESAKARCQRGRGGSTLHNDTYVDLFRLFRRFLQLLSILL